MKNPKVYIIIPFYNVEAYLRDCLHSIINQTYKNLKIILINDGSTDGSERIAKEYLNDDRVLLISKENGGASSARNLGIQKVFSLGGGDEEDYIFFMDSDDFLDLEAIETMLDASSKYAYTDIVRCGALICAEDGKIPQSKDKKIRIDEEWSGLSGIEYLSKIPINYFSASISTLIKVKLIKENNVLFVENIINEDLIFAFKIYILAQSISCIKNPFYNYRRRYGSISCSATFSKHGNTLLFRSYKRNCDYLLEIFKNQEYQKIKNLVRHNLRLCSQIPILCWIKNHKLCSKEDLKELLPFANLKVKIAYYFPLFARFVIKIKNWTKK